MTLPARPAPRAALYEDAFWMQVRGGHVCLQRCAACSHLWYPPGPVCPACLSEDWIWNQVGLTGRAVAWTTFHRAYFKEIPVPHTVVSAALAEGPLLVADYGGDPAALRLHALLRLEVLDVEFRGSPAKSFRWMPAP
jgi:uncharacterized OB-fold protein